MPPSEDPQLYSDLSGLSPALWDDLARLKFADVCLKAGVTWSQDSGYQVPFLGHTYSVYPDSRFITREGPGTPAGFQEGLVILTYLINAREDGLTGRLVSPRELNGGELFFTGPHAPRTEPIVKRFGRESAQFLAKAQSLGARISNDGNASLRWLVLPKILLGATLYEADDEFPAALTITFDANADRHLPLDSLWALINVFNQRLVE